MMILITIRKFNNLTGSIPYWTKHPYVFLVHPETNQTTQTNKAIYERQPHHCGTIVKCSCPKGLEGIDQQG
jgi:hypothetical protein